MEMYGIILSCNYLRKDTTILSDIQAAIKALSYCRIKLKLVIVLRTMKSNGFP